MSALEALDKKRKEDEEALRTARILLTEVYQYQYGFQIHKRIAAFLDSQGIQHD